MLVDSNRAVRPDAVIPFRILVFTAIILLILCKTAYAESLIPEHDGQEHIYDSSEITLVIDDIPIDNDELSIQPVILDNQTYVPAREIFEKIGATVDWRAESEEIFISCEYSSIVLNVDNKNIYVDGVPKTSDAPLKIINDRTMLPLCTISEVIDYDINWDEDTRVITLSNGQYDLAEPVPSVFSESSVPPEPSAAPGPSATPAPSAAPEPSAASGSPTTSGSSDTTDPSATSESPVTRKGINAVDVSDSDIPIEKFGKTVINKITFPEAGQQYRYEITANSAISRISKTYATYADDGRLIIEIFNASLSLPQSDYVINNGFISNIRADHDSSGSEEVSWIIFELTQGVKYSISISEDRKNIIVAFEQNKISDVSFVNDGQNEYVYISGEIAPAVSTTMLSDPNRIVIDIALGTISEKTDYYDGRYVKSVAALQFEPFMARIVINLNTAAGYSISEINNSTIITLSLLSYRNISYDYDNSKLKISKSAVPGLDIKNIEQEDKYYYRNYTFLLDSDYSQGLGYGLFTVDGKYIDAVDIKSVNGKTQLSISEKMILAYNLYDDESYIYIEPVMPKQKYPYIVIIDPGHGGRFSGTSSGRMLEKNLNLAMAQKLVNIIESDGRMKAYLTRVGDYQLNSNLTKDLIQRSSLANSIGDIFVSIHNNSFTRSSVGTETYYCKRNNNIIDGLNSKMLADMIQNRLLINLGSVNRNVKSGNFSVLRNSIVPAVLVEVGFMSNASEMAKLATEEYQMKAARGIFEGLLLACSRYTPKR